MTVDLEKTLCDIGSWTEGTQFDFTRKYGDWNLSVSRIHRDDWECSVTDVDFNLQFHAVADTMAGVIEKLTGWLEKEVGNA